MTDVRDRLSPLKELEAPDLWERVRQHQPAPAPPSPPHRDNRIAVISIAFALAIAAIGFVMIAFRSIQPVTPVGPQPTAVTNGDIWVKVGGGDGETAIYRVEPRRPRDAGAMWTDQGGTFGGASVAPELVSDDYAFSPDGSQVVYSNTVEPGIDDRTALFVMDADGTGRRQLTSGDAYDGLPAWSPGGDSIVYASYRGEDYIPGCLISSLCPTDLYVIGVDGGAPSQLTADVLGETTPTWSPDGLRLAFVVIDSDGVGRLMTMDADGEARTEIPTAESGSISFPSWSPDGTRILFLQYQDGTNHLWTVAPDGSQSRDILDTKTDTNFGRPVWSPEGDRIAYAQMSGLVASVWTTDPRGDALPQRVASWPGIDGDPIAWQPVVAPATSEPDSLDETVTPTSVELSTTYRLSDFHIRSPFNANPTGAAGLGPTAGVTYTATWVTSHYPGEGDCTIVLTDEAGDEVGRKEFGFGGARRVNVIDHWEPIPVDSRPKTASGWCGGDPEAPANFGQGYLWSDPRATDSSRIDGVEITFDVTWVGDDAPGMRKCTLTAALTNGSTRTLAGGIEIGVPHDRSTFLLAGVSAAEVSSASVSCHPPHG